MLLFIWNLLVPAFGAAHYILVYCIITNIHDSALARKNVALDVVYVANIIK